MLTPSLVWYSLNVMFASDKEQETHHPSNTLLYESECLVSESFWRSPFPAPLASSVGGSAFNFLPGSKTSQQLGGHKQTWGRTPFRIFSFPSPELVEYRRRSHSANPTATSTFFFYNRTALGLHIHTPQVGHHGVPSCACLSRTTRPKVWRRQRQGPLLSYLGLRNKPQQE